MIDNIFILNQNLKVKTILSINGKNTFFDDIYSMDLSTGAESYEFSSNVYDIEESDYVMFHYHNEYKLFQIISIEQEHEAGAITTNAYAEGACLELLNGVVRAFSGEFNAISFLEYVLDDSRWQIGMYSTSLADKVVNVQVDKTTQKWSCIQDYMGTFGYELNQRVVYTGGEVLAFVLDVYAEGEIGEKSYRRFEYGRNAKGIVKKKDLTEWCTALILDTNQDVTDVEYNEDGYVKASGSDVVLATNENTIYNSGRDYIYANFEDNDSTSGQEVVENAVEYLKKNAIPHFDYEVDTALTYEEYNELNIGDTVYVIDSTFSPIVTLEARIGKLEISFSDRNNCKCNLTNFKEVKSGIAAALTGSVKNIIDTYFPITSDKLANGSVIEGKIETTYYQQIVADSVVASQVVTEKLIAEEAEITHGRFETIEARQGTFEELTAENFTATNGNISNLQSDVAHIGTLIGGNASIQDIQTLILTSENVTIDNALIKDAMIETVSANKINTGTINTNNVSIQSEDGTLLINGTTQQFKDENNTVRIQIGKDATGNFTFALFSQDGKGILIDADGIKAGAVPDGLIVDDMVSDNANISGGKIDISSLITEINDNENTIKSSKIYLDDTSQTLEVAFNQLKTKVETIEDVTIDIDGGLSSIIEQVETNTTDIEVTQGQISTLITNTTITKEDGTVVQMKDEFNSVQDTVNSHTQTISSLETTTNTVSSKQTALEQNLDGFKTTVSETYATQESLNTTNNNVSTVSQKADRIDWVVSSSSTSESSMTLTSTMYSLISKNITLSADHIDLHGYVTANGNFSIDTSGNMTAKEGTFSGSIIGGEIEIGTSDDGLRPGFYVKSTGEVHIGNVSAEGTYQAVRIGRTGNIKVGGLSPVVYAGDQRGIFEITSLGTMYSCSASDANVYTRVTEGKITLKDYDVMNGNDSTIITTTIGNGGITIGSTQYLDSYIYTEASQMVIDNAINTNGKNIYAGSYYMDNAQVIRSYATDGTATTLLHMGSDDIIKMGYGSWDNQTNSTQVLGNNVGVRSRGSIYLCPNGNDTTTTGTIRVYNNADGNYMFNPIVANTNYLGSSTYYWKSATSAAWNNSSDRRLKENISYISNVTNENLVQPLSTDDTITQQDLYDFVKDELPIATYNYIGDNKQKVGFMIQDILTKADGSISKVGNMIADSNPPIEDDESTPILTYDLGNMINTLAGALQVAMDKIETLEKIINGGNSNE